MSGITFRHKGDFSKTEKFFNSLLKLDYQEGFEERLFSSFMMESMAMDRAEMEEFADMLKKHIRLYVRPATGQPVEATERTAANAATTPDWLIDYRYATVTEEDGKTVVTFPTKTGAAKDTSALNLASGATYYFRLEGIFDRAQPDGQHQPAGFPHRLCPGFPEPDQCGKH